MELFVRLGHAVYRTQTPSIISPFDATNAGVTQDRRQPLVFVTEKMFLGSGCVWPKHTQPEPKNSVYVGRP